MQIKKTKQQKKEKIMKLKDYVELECIHYAKASKRLGISVSEYYALVNGKTDPRASLIHKIEKFTKGCVKYKDWLETYNNQSDADENKNTDESQAPPNTGFGFDNVP